MTEFRTILDKCYLLVNRETGRVRYQASERDLLPDLNNLYELVEAYERKDQAKSEVTGRWEYTGVVGYELIDDDRVPLYLGAGLYLVSQEVAERI